MLLDTQDQYQEYPLLKFCICWRNLNPNLIVATCQYENEVLLPILHMAKTGGTCCNIREVNTLFLLEFKAWNNALAN